MDRIKQFQETTEQFSLMVNRGMSQDFVLQIMQITELKQISDSLFALSMDSRDKWGLENWGVENGRNS